MNSLNFTLELGFIALEVNKHKYVGKCLTLVEYGRNCKIMSVLSQMSLPLVTDHSLKTYTKSFIMKLIQHKMPYKLKHNKTGHF
jgi:hypothetical protein